MVLLIDDDEGIREALRDILEFVDISAVLAADGSAGIALYEQYRDTIDAVVLDLHMPGLSGIDTYYRLRALNPKLKIVLSSGFDDQDIMQTLPNDDGVYYLQKPYSIDTLIARIQSILQQ